MKHVILIFLISNLLLLFFQKYNSFNFYILLEIISK